MVKGSYPAQDGGGEQIGLGVKGPAFEPRVLALGDEPLHVLVGQLQIPQRRALKVAAAVRILGGLPQSFQRQGQIALDDLLALPAARQPLSQVTGARIDLATACLLGRERDQAEETLRDVIAGSSSLGNISLSGRLARTRETLASPAWSKDPAARQLDDTISEWLAQPGADGRG